MPLTLRLPFVMVDCHWRLERVLAADTDRSWARCRLLLPCFELSRPERQFARRLLLRKRNLWLYRCNQREFCGDFIAVDMSSSRRPLRAVLLLELKARAPVRLGGSGAGNQMQRAPRAVTELIDREQVIAADSPLTLASGSGEALHRWIAAGSPPADCF